MLSELTYVFSRKNAESMERNLCIPQLMPDIQTRRKNNNFHEVHNSAAALGLNHQQKNLITDSKYYFPSVAKCGLHCTDKHETRTVHQHYLQKFKKDFHNFRSRNVEIMSRKVFTYLSIALTAY